MSASLIGRMRSSAFRLSTITVSRSLASTRFRGRGGTIFGATLPDKNAGRLPHLWVKSRHRNGSVEPAPKSGHWNSVAQCPLCAKCGHCTVWKLLESKREAVSLATLLWALSYGPNLRHCPAHDQAHQAAKDDFRDFM